MLSKTLIYFSRPIYSTNAGITSPSSIVITNLNDFVNRALEVIRKLDELIGENLGAVGINTTDDALVKHH